MNGIHSVKVIVSGCFFCLMSFAIQLFPAAGDLVFKFQTGGPVFSSPAVGWDGTIYVGSEDNNLYTVNTDGSLGWQITTNGPVKSSPAINWDGRVYFGSYDNNVYCLDSTNGELLWKFPTNGFVNAVGFDDGRVYAGSWDCNMYCIDAETGRLLWKFKTSMSTPSTIAPPEAAMSKTAEITWTPETGEGKKKYRPGEGGGDYDINLSQYGAMDRGYLGAKKKGYIK